ncbi:MAG TPA: hypothetical protein PKV92_07860 [Thermodesulfovibrio thiophilus]|nr:hypothetical protein [Thermodesulfovibrio thiophilus]HQD36993.1 hypothetical protein [Thermodesulfovibrio thiophilus]
MNTLNIHDVDIETIRKLKDAGFKAEQFYSSVTNKYFYVAFIKAGDTDINLYSKQYETKLEE